jgi:hypothetical protein
MSALLIAWNLAKQFWLPLLLAGALALLTAWHFNAIHVAKNEVRAEYEAKIKANSEAYAIKLKMRDDETKAKQETFNAKLDETVINAEKAIKNADEKHKVALARVATGDLILRDKFKPAERCTVTSEAKSQSAAELDNGAGGSGLSGQLTEFLIGRANSADKAIVKLTAAQAVIRDMYAACQ